MASPGNPAGNPKGSSPERSTYSMVAKAAKQEEMLRYLLTGHSLKECAQLCKVSYQTAANYVREPLFLERLRGLSSEVYADLDKQIALTKTAAAERINELSQKALDRMETIIENGGDNVAYKACQDILDRNVEVPRNRRVEGELTQRVFDPAALLHAANVASELEMMRESQNSAPRTTTLEGQQSEG